MSNISSNIIFFIFSDRIQERIYFQNPPKEAVRQPLSPPLPGGDKGEGEYEIAENTVIFPPPPLPSPVKGEGVIRL
jgi:hypothetical protein